MSELCFITGDYTCDDDYEDCAKCPKYKHEVEKDIDKELPWRVTTLMNMSLPIGSPDK